MRHFAAIRHIVLPLVAIVALVLSRHALAQALERAEAQLRDPAATGPEFVGIPRASAPARESGYLGIKADDRDTQGGVRIAEVINARSGRGRRPTSWGPDHPSAWQRGANG